jgi:hypothetical protein
MGRAFNLDGTSYVDLGNGTSAQVSNSLEDPSPSPGSRKTLPSIAFILANVETFRRFRLRRRKTPYSETVPIAFRKRSLKVVFALLRYLQ